MSFYTTIQDVLTRTELKILKRLTYNSPNNNWYGRYTFYREQFIFENAEISPTNKPRWLEPEYVINKLARTFLDQLHICSPDEVPNRVHMEIYYDRSVNGFLKDDTSENDIFWHQDTIKIPDREDETPQYTMVLMMSRNENDWEGGDILIQAGGHYDDNFDWVLSDQPQYQIQHRYNAAVIFKNDNSAHMVTKVLSKKAHKDAIRDVIIMTCYYD